MGIYEWFAKKSPPKEPTLPRINQSEIQTIENLLVEKEGKKQLQKIDELITVAEIEIIELSKTLDKAVTEERIVENALESAASGSWTQQSLLLKLKRLKTHSDNLKQRIMIYSQNIELYLNMIHRIQDKQAMKMGGIDETRIENVWLEYREELDQYKNKLMTSQSASDNTSVLTQQSEKSLETLRAKIEKRDEEIEQERDEIDEEIDEEEAPQLE